MQKRSLIAVLISTALAACSGSSDTESTGGDNLNQLTNSAPTLLNNSFSVGYHETLTINVSDLATDSDNDALSLSNIQNENGLTIDAATSSFVIYPSSNLVGDQTILFSVSDGTDGVDGTITVSITNASPVANDVSVETNSNTSLTLIADATDLEDDIASIEFDEPKNGTVTTVDDVTTYSPNANYVGNDEITYTATDEVGETATATITINVLNQAPIAESLSLQTTENTELTLDLSASISDPEFGELTIEFNTPENGIITEAGNVFTYTPNTDFVGEETVEYTVTDEYNASSSATLNITVLEVSSVYNGVIKLNDTGSTICYDVDFGDEIEECDSITHEGQDSQSGRDALNATNSLTKIGAGNGGFDFTKLSETGETLPNDATEFSCVRDNHTGLVWETKVNDKTSVHHYEWQYSYTTNDSAPQLAKDEFGLGREEDCLNGENCSTGEFIATVNEAQLCGISDWRLPSELEVRNLMDYSQTEPRAVFDENYFPNMIYSVQIWTNTYHFKPSSSYKLGIRIVDLENFDLERYTVPDLGHLGQNVVLVAQPQSAGE